MDYTPLIIIMTGNDTGTPNMIIVCIYCTSVIVPGGKKKSIPFRRQRMEIDTAVPEFDGPSKPLMLSSDDPYVADLLQVADTRIQELERQLGIFGDEKEVIDRKLKNFRQQVGGHCCIVTSVIHFIL